MTSRVYPWNCPYPVCSKTSACLGLLFLWLCCVFAPFRRRLRRLRGFCAKGKKEEGSFRDVLPTPELGWAITTVSKVLLTMSLLQSFGGSRLLPACSFDRAPLLCGPVLPQHCHLCFGTVVVGTVGLATNGSITSG